jgi:large subunit ribosomal protein L10
MTRTEKNAIIDSLTESLKQYPTVYLADTTGMTVAVNNKLRRICIEKNIKLQVVKNTLLKKAMEKSEKDFSGLFDTLHGTTAILLSETGNAPAKLMKSFKSQSDKLKLKGAFVEEAVFVGENQLDVLFSLKSREEQIGDIIGLLQSPMKNVISALQNNGGQKIAGLVKALEEKKA